MAVLSTMDVPAFLSDRRSRVRWEQRMLHGWNSNKNINPTKRVLGKKERYYKPLKNERHPEVKNERTDSCLSRGVLTCVTDTIVEQSSTEIPTLTATDSTSSNIIFSRAEDVLVSTVIAGSFDTASAQVAHYPYMMVEEQVAEKEVFSAVPTIVSCPVVVTEVEVKVVPEIQSEEITNAEIEDCLFFRGALWWIVQSGDVEELAAEKMQ